MNGAVPAGRAGDQGAPWPVLRVEKLVGELTRARLLQRVIEHCLVGLLVALVASVVAVLAIRMQWLALPLLPTVVALLGAGLLCAGATAVASRPDSLRVTIDADLALHLKQRLSTTWELLRAGGDAGLVARLAEHAVRARLPARVEHVFPVRYGICARLVPVAAALLLVVSTVDVRRIVESAPPVSDRAVIEEGARLREFARQMAEQAAREALTRSAAAAQSMQRLGARMESGALSRSQSLDRLRQLDSELDAERRAALADGREVQTGPLDVEPVESRPAPGASALRQLLQDLLDGRASSEELTPFTADEQTLAQLGIDPEALKDALDRLDAGDRDAVRRILDDLARSAQSERDAAELRRAQRQLDQARRSLGDTVGDASPSGRAPARAEGAGGEGDGDGEASADGMSPEEGIEGAPLGGPPGGSGSAGEGATERRAEAPRPSDRTASGAAVVRPEGQPGEGRVFVSEARVLPTANPATTDTTAIAARFQPQLEAVLAREDVPPHRKALIRRYFLNLSQGLPPTDARDEDQR